MRITKLVTGILLIMLSVWLLVEGLMNCILGVWTERNIASGVLEIILGGLFMGAGIVYICLENDPFMGGDITCFILLIIGAIVGFVGCFFNRWMFLYAVISLIVGIGFFVWHRRIGEEV